MVEEETSEEKLLKLIRKKKKSVPPENDKGSSEGCPASQAKKKKRDFHFLEVNSFLLLFLSIGGVFFIINNYILDKPKRDESLNVTDEESEDVLVVENSILSNVKPFEYYEGRFKERNVFEMDVEKPEVQKLVTKDSELNLDQQLIIVGMIVDKDPKVIIENTQTHQTFFVSEGEFIGDALIEEIRQDKVTLNINNKKLILTP